MTVSIKDIAKAAGVSHSTVSRALGESPLVSPDTKDRIQRLAREMGYSPDAQARSLVMGRTQTIGIVVTTITDPFIAEIVQAVESTAHDHGYSVILASSNSRRRREIAAVEMLRSKRVDAVIVTSSRVGALYQAHLDQLGAPVVLINSRSEQRGPYTFSVTVDNRHGACLATGHLIRRGHRRIAYIAGAANHSDDFDRMAGYRQALGEANIAFEPSLVVRGTGRVDCGEEALTAVMDRSDVPSAAFCYNDMTAIGLLRAARTAGVSVPRELAVVGFDDIPFAAYVSPALTTIAQPKPEMGKRAVEMALALAGGEVSDLPGFTNVVVRGRLVVRESSGERMQVEHQPASESDGGGSS
ncbi:MAG: LacI family transcriptional regulator [Anaerolineae bacterium]|nr:LacI family transcriptional regulator [Anaerolineae bacterium]